MLYKNKKKSTTATNSHAPRTLVHEIKSEDSIQYRQKIRNVFAKNIKN